MHVLLSLLGFFSSFTLDATEPFFPLLKDRTLQIGCKLWSPEMTFFGGVPGTVCHFIPGTDKVVSSDEASTTSLWSMRGELLWKKPFGIHHQMKPNADGKTLAALGHDVRLVKRQRVRFDRLMVLNFDGNVLKEYSFYDHRREIDRLNPTADLYKKSPWSKRLTGAEIEHTHTNSIYEIPPNKMADKIPAFAAGNFVVNVNYLSRVLILDKDLRSILWVFHYKHGNRLHDVQVLPNGNLLAYSNSKKVSKLTFTSLDEINPLTGDPVWNYHADPPESFHSKFRGGVQLVEDKYILSSETGHKAKVFLVERATKQVVWRQPVNALAGVPAPEQVYGGSHFQEAKLGDFSSHLSKLP